MEFDIHKNKEREVLCIRNDSDVWACGENSHLLTIGEKYIVDCVMIDAWSTEVYLREFPGIPFNSVLFEEIEN